MPISMIDLTGSRFGRLLVTSKYGSYKNPSGKTKATLWNCVCTCGKDVVVRGDMLRKGIIVSCGCYGKYRTFVDITNKRFGKLVAIRVAEKSRKLKTYRTPSKWLCKCDCGNTIIVSVRALNTGATISCGCAHESNLATQLKSYFKENYDALLEYCAVRNPNTGKWLRFDIFIPQYNAFIEVHGQQHYEFIEWFHKSKDKFVKSKYLDALKKQFASQMGIYIEIDIRKIKTSKDAIVYIEQRL